MGDKERDWFRKMGPKGYRIRMMEPGEAPALFSILKGSSALITAAGQPPPDLVDATLDDFVRWLLQHEVFVATTKAGEPVGFAVAGDAVDLYWLTGLHVTPDHQRRGVGSALIAAVLRRAGWFFHRAVGLSAYRDLTFHAPLFSRRGFMAVLRKDFPAILEDRFLREMPSQAKEEERIVMVKWL